MGLLGEIADVGLGIYNTYTQNRVADENLAMQRDVFNYQKAQQDITRQREDNAFQRRVKDVTAAGFSPLAALGQSAASSSPISVNAPQRQAVTANLGKMDFEGAAMALMTQKQNIEQTQAQIDLINQQKENASLENDEKKYNLDWYKNAGIPTNAPNQSKLVGDAINRLGGNGAVIGASKEVIRKVVPQGADVQKDEWLKQREESYKKGMEGLKKGITDFLNYKPSGYQMTSDNGVVRITK